MLRKVTIEPVLNGWIVTVGCQRVVFDDKKIMLEKISEYLSDPEKIEEEYRRFAVNAKYTLRDAEATSRG